MGALEVLRGKQRQLLERDHAFALHAPIIIPHIPVLWLAVKQLLVPGHVPAALAKNLEQLPRWYVAQAVPCRFNAGRSVAFVTPTPRLITHVPRGGFTYYAPPW